MNYNLKGVFHGMDIFNKAPAVIKYEDRRFVKAVWPENSHDIKDSGSDSINIRGIIVYQEERLVKKRLLFIFKTEIWEGPFSIIEIGPISKKEEYGELKVALYLEKVKEGCSYLIDASKSVETADVKFPSDVNLVMDTFMAALRNYQTNQK